jgi:hypothetical protein
VREVKLICCQLKLSTCQQAPSHCIFFISERSTRTPSVDGSPPIEPKNEIPRIHKNQSLVMKFVYMNKSVATLSASSLHSVSTCRHFYYFCCRCCCWTQTNKFEQCFALGALARLFMLCTTMRKSGVSHCMKIGLPETRRRKMQINIKFEFELIQKRV